MNPNLLYLLPPSPFVLLSPLSAAMDPYFHHSRHPNTYIPLSPPYNHHHLRQVSNHVLVNPTAFNFNPPVFLPANPLFVPQVPVLFEHDSRHRSSMLSQSPSNSNPRRSASRFSKECFGRANRRCRVVVPPNSGTITIEQIGFMNIMAFQRNRLRVRVFFLESRRQNRAMDVMLHDLDSANAQPQGGQESIDECKQWIWWLRSTGTESIDECCASTRISVGDFNARELLSQCWWSTFTKPCYGYVE
ncbi:hypothetical protein HN51_062083 [Arachis hypogaea]